MYDLKKVEEKFHEFLKSGLNEEKYKINEIKLSENLLEQQEAFYIPFGWISYFLVIEDEKPIVYAHALTRMDLDLLAIIDENGYKVYDGWEEGHEDIWKNYVNYSEKVKRFDYNDLKFISDARK